MSTPPDKFEEGLRALEQIVERLETGDLSLEEALTSFEDGVGLIKHLRDKLTEVEKRIEILTRDQGGAFQLQPLTEDEEPQ